MDLQALPVSAIDPSGVWPALQTYIEQRTPLKAVKVSEKLNLDIHLCFNTETLPWLSAAPYATIYVLCFEDYADYSLTLKEPFNLWLRSKVMQAADWLILYIPSSKPSPVMQSKFRLNYDQLRADLGSACEGSLVRLYSDNLQNYLDVSHPSSALEEYWTPFLKLLKQKLAIGIEHRLSYVKGLIKSQLSELGEGATWSLAVAESMEELAEVNLLLGRHEKVALLSSQLLENANQIELVQAYTPLCTEMSLTQFREKFADGSLTEIDYNFFMMRRQYICLKVIGKSLRLQSRLLRFFFVNMLCLQRSHATVSEVATWEYLASKYFLDLVESEEFQEIDHQIMQKDLAGVLKRYSKSRLERIAYNSLQLDDILPGLNITEPLPALKRGYSALEDPELAQAELLKLTEELIGYYQTSERNAYKVAPFKAEKAMLLKRLGQTPQALKIFKTLSNDLANWPTLKLATMLAQLQCERDLGKTQAVVEISAAICKSQAYLPATTLQRVWSYIISAEQECRVPNDGLFTSHISVSPTKLHKGQDLTVTCVLFNPLPFEFDVKSISVNFFRDEFIFSIFASQQKLNSGENLFSLKSKAPGPGVFKHVQLEIKVENVLFKSPPQSINLVINSSGHVSLGFKLPTLLMLNQTQLCVVSIETTTEGLTDGTLTLSPASVRIKQLLDHCKSVECIIATPKPDRFFLELNAQNEVSLQHLPPSAECYLMLPILQAASWDDPRFDKDELETLATYTFSSIGKHTIQELFNTRGIKQDLSIQLTAAVVSKLIRLDFSYLTEDNQRDHIEYILEHKQHFIDPFALSHEILEVPQGIILKIMVENCAHLPLTITGCKLDGAQVIEDGLAQPATLRTGQQLYLVFILGCFNKHILKLSLLFSYALTHASLNSSITEEIHRVFLQQTFSYEKKISLTNFHVEHCNEVTLDQAYIVTLTAPVVKAPFNATFALKKILHWKVEEPVNFLVTSECTQSLRAWSLSPQNSHIPPPYLIIDGEEFELSCEGNLKFEVPNESLS